MFVGAPGIRYLVMLAAAAAYTKAMVGHDVQASTFVMFPDVFSACKAAHILRDDTAVDAVEMFDRAACRCVLLQATPLLLGAVNDSICMHSVIKGGLDMQHGTAAASQHIWLHHCRACDPGHVCEKSNAAPAVGLASHSPTA